MATIITDATELQAMKDNLADDYELGNDIDASATVGWNGGLGFEPVGPSGTPFTGSLDGKGFTISDLFINRPLLDYIGLFGTVDGATIVNVTLVDVDITGDDYVGGFAGRINTASVTNCSVSGIVTGDTYVGGFAGYCYEEDISNCSADVTVTGTSSRVGGFVGVAYSGLITECFSEGNVTGGRWVGGFVGAASTHITKSYSKGNAIGTALETHVGGFAGDNVSVIENCYAFGDAAGDDTPGFHAYAGGFVGRNYVTVENCYSTGIASGLNNVGGFCGENNDSITNCFWDTETSGTGVSDGGTGKTTAQMKAITTFAAWDIIQSASDLASGYPYLSWQLGSSHIWYIFGAIPDVPDSPRTTVDVQDITPLEAIRNIEMAARGRFYTDEEGNAVYKSRYGRNPL